MPATERQFGYYPVPLDLTAGAISIETLPELERTVADIESDELVDNGWIYAPLQRVKPLGGEVFERPYSARVFGLPKTHRFRHAAPDCDDQLVFHLWALSFFTGTRLTSAEAGFLDATPIKPGKLVDFVLLGRSLEYGVEVAETFWLAHRCDQRRAKLVAAAIHAMFLGQYPQLLQFERFLLLYSAFDACFALAEAIHQPKGRITHTARVEWMCDRFGIPVPAWAATSATSRPELAMLRNAAVHEAMFMGEPLGFALHGVHKPQNLTLEMKALICRFIVALLGASADEYLQARVDTRQRQGLRLGEAPG